MKEILLRTQRVKGTQYILSLDVNEQLMIMVQKMPKVKERASCECN